MDRKHSGVIQSGFGLVEIMVALVIGLLTTLVIMQVFSAFEGQKRATMGSADAQTTGNIALYSIGRDLQMAGYGLLPIVGSSPYACDPLPTFDDDNDVSTARVTFDLTPVSIGDGGNGAGASDTVAVAYGSSLMGGVPTVIGALVGTTATTGNNLGCRTNDVALIINGTSCTTTRVVGPTDIATPAVASTPPNTKDIVLQDVVGVTLGANLACLGTWTRTTYGVSGENLVVSGVATLAGIVNLQAQYGISDSANSNKITKWVNATAATGWDAPTIANRNRIKAIRIAIVARNGQYERDEVSTACTSTTTASPSGLCAWEGSATSPAPTIDLSNDADWKHYRYRVFETIIPLRNVIWSKDSL